MKFILLHEGKNDEGIKSFFMDVWELYVKVRYLYSHCDNTNDSEYVEPIPKCSKIDKKWCI